MKFPIYRVGLIFGIMSLASMGCEQSGHKEIAKQAKPDDPSVWSEKDIQRGDSESTTPAGMPKSSRSPGAWSSEAQSVERNLGIGQ